MVKFFRGLAAKYDQAAHKDGLYFATDKGQLFLNGVEYGSAGLVKDVVLEDNVLTVSYKDTNEVKTFNFIDLLAKASAEGDGLMLAADKVLLDEIRKGLEEEGATLFTAADQDRLGKAEEDIVALNERVADDEQALVDAKAALEQAIASEKELRVAEDERLAGLIANETETREGAMADLKDAYTAAVAEEAGARESADNALAAEIDVERKRIDVLVGDVEGDDERSAREIVQDEVAKQLTSENISESFDTLKEMAEWLSSHPDTVQDLTDGIAANAEDIDAIEAVLAGYGAGEGETATVKADIAGLAGRIDGNDAAIADLQAAVGEDGSVDERIASAVTECKEYTDDAFTAFKAEYVDTTAVIGVNLTNTEGVVGINVVAADLGAALVGTAEAQGPITAVTTFVGKAVSGVTAIEATSTVADALQTIATDVKNITDSAVTAITGDDYITVTGEGNDRALAFEIQKVGAYLVNNKESALQVDEDGKLALKWFDVE